MLLSLVCLPCSWVVFLIVNFAPPVSFEFRFPTVPPVIVLGASCVSLGSSVSPSASFLSFHVVSG